MIPTDTVYGVAAAVAPGPVRRLYLAKGRPESRPIPLLVAGTAAARTVVATWPPEAEVLAERFWPGALTIVLPAQPALPEEVTAGTGTVGVRWPRGALVEEVIAGAGGVLAVTSANRTGRPPATRASEAAEALGDAVAYILDGGCLEGNVASTVVELGRDGHRILREGPIGSAQIEETLQAYHQSHFAVRDTK